MNDTGTKKEARSFLSKKIACMLPGEKREESLRISELLFAQPEWKKAVTVLAFFSMEQEVQTYFILNRALAEGKTLALPRMYGSTIVFHEVPSVDAAFFDMHPYGIKEPKSSLPVVVPSAERPALIVTPGLGFTPGGSRIGHGKGFYDRYFALYGKYLSIAAVAFDCQIVETLPVEPFDQQIPVIITPSRVYRTG